MIIIPSILTNSPDELARMIEESEEAVDRVQVDIVDGVFAENKTIDPLALKYIDTNLKIDFHLMVANPAGWVEKCAGVGADRIIAQVESMDSQEDFLKNVQLTGASPGFAVNLKTPIGMIDEVLMTDISVLLLMSVPAGLGGQKFDSAVYEKIKEASLLREKSGAFYKICVDGGVGEDNISTLFKLKVDEVSVGRSLFAGKLEENITILLNKAKS
jgi:ribulose-phosphate 3-epimerase